MLLKGGKRLILNYKKGDVYPMSIDRKSNEYSNQEIIEKLRAIIDLEESKPLAERDVDLITECVDYLMELEQGVELTQEELEEEKQKIYAYNKNLNKPAKRLKFKGLLVAACFVILMLLANFAAMACGIDTISILKEWGHRIVEMFEGEKAEYKGITIINEGESISYSSNEEFVNKENLNILYPTKLPENIQIIQIAVSGSYDSNYNYSSEFRRVFYVTNNNNTNIIVNTNPNVSRDFLENPNLKIETIGSYECYIDCFDNLIQCTFIYNDITYTVKTTTHDSLVTIITNLKENI